MNNYSAKWSTAIIIAIIFHAIILIVLNFLLPYLLPPSKVNEIAEISWIDVDLIEEETIIEEEDQPIEESESQSQSTISEFEFPPLIIPEISNDPVYVEELPPTSKQVDNEKISSIKKSEEPKIAKNESEAIEQMKRNPTAEIVYTKPPKENRNYDQKMAEPPITLNEKIPQLDSGLNYNGYVSVAVTIGLDGKVKDAKIVWSSSRIIVDNIAMNAAREWTFKPAIDQDGKPMECDKIITFDFRKIS
ncbi:MAG: TonB family protein [Selenomonadaceae bacterium]|nr:TonB family protein [Selenomonadaceae bacterium]